MSLYEILKENQIDINSLPNKNRNLFSIREDILSGNHNSINLLTETDIDYLNDVNIDYLYYLKKFKNKYSTFIYCVSEYQNYSANKWINLINYILSISVQKGDVENYINVLCYDYKKEKNNLLVKLCIDNLYNKYKDCPENVNIAMCYRSIIARGNLPWLFYLIDRIPYKNFEIFFPQACIFCNKEIVEWMISVLPDWKTYLNDSDTINRIIDTKNKSFVNFLIQNGMEFRRVELARLKK
jgi:hypothetical protein